LMPGSDDHAYVSRGGLKLAAALEAFGVSPAGWVCADLGSNVGGFVDCLLRHGAERVYALDTGYGVLAYRLRRDPRVVVRERTNALHAVLPEPVDLVTIDVGWTPQEYILPAAVRMLRGSGAGAGDGGRSSGRWIVALIKPHYEAQAGRRAHISGRQQGGVLDPEEARLAFEGACARIRGLGLSVVRTIQSPIRGRKGNVEYLALLSPATL